VKAGKIPKESESSTFAQEGTRAHEVAALVLTDKEHAFESDEQKDAVTVYTDFVKSLKREGAMFFVEQSVPLAYKPEDNGTVDAAIISGAQDRHYGPEIRSRC
jgi:hypothetical protein